MPNKNTTWDQYRCHKIYIPETKDKRISDTMEFYPKQCNIPYASSLEEAIVAIKNLAAALAYAKPSSPYLTTDEEIKELQTLKKIFTNKHTQPRVGTTINNTHSRVSPSTPNNNNNNDSNPQTRVPKGYTSPHDYKHIHDPSHRYPTRSSGDATRRYPTRLRASANSLLTIIEEKDEQ